eukprot:scaffold6466_cov38-Attheya_sp.AAC.7
MRPRRGGGAKENRRKRACWTSQGSGPLILWATSPGHPAYHHQPQPTPNANHNIHPDQAHGSSGPCRSPTRRDHMDHQNRWSLVTDNTVDQHFAHGCGRI